jgi:hypothetical protein
MILMAQKMAQVRGVRLRGEGRRPTASLGENVWQLELINRSSHEVCGAFEEKEVLSHEELREGVCEFGPFPLMMWIATIRLLSRVMEDFMRIGMEQRTVTYFLR